MLGGKFAGYANPTSSSSAPTEFERGWVGFGRNYYRNLGAEPWTRMPPQSQIEDDFEEEYNDDDSDEDETEPSEAPYQWAGHEKAYDTKQQPPSKRAIQQPPPYTWRPSDLAAYQFGREVPKAPKKKVAPKKNKKDKPPSNHTKNGTATVLPPHVAPAACSSGATMFLSGQRHNRIITLGTMHGRVHDPTCDADASRCMSWTVSPSTITIPIPLPCVELAAGRHFCLARLEGGLAVCSWGAGHFGQLGHGRTHHDDNDPSNPQQQQQLHAPGDNPSTYLSQPRIMERLLPRAIGCPVAQIAAGDWHGMALAQDGTVYAWGCNRNGQCGRRPQQVTSTSPSSEGSTAKSSQTTTTTTTTAPLQLVPIPVAIQTTIYKEDGTMTKQSVCVAQIACGRAHSVAISTQQQVFCWGASHYGQCGNAPGSNAAGAASKRARGTLIPPRLVEGLKDVFIVQVAAGDRHTLALTQGGRVFAWGAGGEGQLGLGTAIVCTPKPKLLADLDFVAIAAGRDFQLLQQQKLQASSSTTTSSSNQSQQTTQPHALEKIPTITSVYAAGCYSMALSSNGHVYGWGSNDTGVLGIPTPSPSKKVPWWELGVTPPPRPKSNLRLMQVQTFDSYHNILLPRRVQALDQLHVEQIICGPSHMWCLGQVRKEKKHAGDGGEEDEENVVGTTLYEVQRARRRLGRVQGEQSSMVAVSSHSSLSAVGISAHSETTPPPGPFLSQSSRVSTMPTDNEDDSGTETAASSTKLLASGSFERLLGSSGTRASRRHSIGSVPTNNSKRSQFSFNNFMKKLGGNRPRGRHSTTVTVEEDNHASLSALQDMDVPSRSSIEVDLHASLPNLGQSFTEHGTSATGSTGVRKGIMGGRSKFG